MGSVCPLPFCEGAAMKSAQSFNQVFIHRDPIDMRKGINGLCDIIQGANMGNIREKNLFVFCGRRRDSVKILYFDRSGFCLWQKRLELERFPWPKKHTESIVNIQPEQLNWLLDGIDVWKMKPFEEVYFERVA
jgi:transposase